MSTLFGSNEFSAHDYSKQKQVDLQWAQKSAMAMPLAQRQGLENAGYNPLLGQQASSAVELSGGQSAGAGQGVSDDDNSGLSRMQMSAMMKDMQIKDAQVDIAKAEADVKKSEAGEIVRHNKAQEKFERDLNKEQIYRNNYNEEVRKNHPQVADILGQLGFEPYGFTKDAIKTIGKAIATIGFGAVLVKLRKVNVLKLAKDIGKLKDLLSIS